MSKGLPELITPYSTTEFHAMVEAARAHHHAMHDQLVIMSAELYRGLSKVQGARGLFGVDVKIAARRVSKHLAHAAGMEMATAKAIVRSYTQYTELFLNKSNAAPATAFNLDK